jgi:anaerobic selenocysteine-containing dehydrogenase
VQAQDGSLAVLHYQSAGSMGLLKALNSRFFNLWGGVTEAVGSLCAGAGIAGQLSGYGAVRSHAPQDLLNSRTILIWGVIPSSPISICFPIEDRQGTWGDSGGHRPRRTETVKYADQHVGLKPGRCLSGHRPGAIAVAARTGGLGDSDHCHGQLR